MVRILVHLSSFPGRVDNIKLPSMPLIPYCFKQYSHLSIAPPSHTRYYFTGYASAGFAIVVADCFNNHSHTHEMGHNLGCYHNPEDTSRVHDYAYGFRYCDRGDMS